MNSISNFVFRQCLCLSTRQFLFINSRTYKSNLSYDKLFPKCQSLDVVSGPIKSVFFFVVKINIYIKIDSFSRQANQLVAKNSMDLFL